jgi:hypothetical protein
MKPGIYHNISAKEYHALTDIVSNSYLGKLARVPAAAKLPQEETEAMTFGRAFHCYVLEGGEAFYERFLCFDSIPAKPTKRSTQKTVDNYAAWLQSLSGVAAITKEDLCAIQEMDKAVYRHPFACELLKNGISETSIFWDDTDTGLPCKVRPDRIPDGNKGVILDLKSTANAAPVPFRNDCVKFGYAREGGMYLEGLCKVTGAIFNDLIFALIAVEKKEPYRVEVYTLDVEFVDYGFKEFKRLLYLEKQCRDNNFWPHYVNAGAETLTRPAYLQTWEGEFDD